MQDPSRASRIRLLALIIAFSSHLISQTVPGITPRAPYIPPAPVVGGTVSAQSASLPIPRPTLSDSDRFRAVRQRPVQRGFGILSWTTDGDHEDAGVLTDGGGPFRGVFALHAIYAEGTVQLKLPTNATRTQTLFAPTTRPANGGCLEVGTAYTTEVAATSRVRVYVFDFCKSPKPEFTNVSITVDSDFMNTYAGAMIQGVPAYPVAIYTSDTELSSSTEWNAALYNYKSQQWEIKYSSRGIYADDSRGWSIFETWYQAGQCSESLPVLGADALMYYNSLTHAWQQASQAMSGLTNYVHGGGPCFQADSGEPPSYQLKVSGFDSWIVATRSPGPTPHQ
jgi:hypothetical protein